MVCSKQWLTFFHSRHTMPAERYLSPMGSPRSVSHTYSNNDENQDRNRGTAKLPDEAVPTVSIAAATPGNGFSGCEGRRGVISTIEDSVEVTTLGTPPRRIYILGHGNVGKLVAHSLAGIPNQPPITFLLHHQSLVRQWCKGGKSIEIVQHGTAERSSGYDVELISSSGRGDPTLLEIQRPIHNLIVSVKAPATVEALSTIVHRLGRESTLLFVNDGMGILDELNQKLFTDPETRPGYMVGVSTYGLRTLSAFSSALYGVGTIGIGVFSAQGFGVSEQTSPILSPSARYLLRTMTRTPSLAAMGLTTIDLYQLQLERLVTKAIVDTLTVVFDCRNGELLDNFGVTRVMRLLISEISLVIRSLPELQDVPNLDSRFSVAKLEYQSVSLAKTTASQRSLMLQEVMSGRMTDIDYSIGYIVGRGKELGVKCVMNYMLMQMVKGKQNMESRKIEGILPVNISELPVVER